jgi:hypothetical protein
MTFPVAGIAPQAGARHVTLMRDAAGATYPNPMRIVELIPRPAPRARVRKDETSACPCPASTCRSAQAMGSAARSLRHSRRTARVSPSPRTMAPTSRKRPTRSGWSTFTLTGIGQREGRALENVESKAAAP